MTLHLYVFGGLIPAFDQCVWGELACTHALGVSFGFLLQVIGMSEVSYLYKAGCIYFFSNVRSNINKCTFYCNCSGFTDPPDKDFDLIWSNRKLTQQSGELNQTSSKPRVGEFQSV